MAEPIAGAVYYVRDRDLTLPPNEDRHYHDERRPVLVISGSRNQLRPFVEVRARRAYFFIYYPQDTVLCIAACGRREPA